MVKKRLLNATMLFITLSIWLVSFILTEVRWTTPQPNPIQVSLVQGNIPQTLKWQPSQTRETLAIYKNLTEQHLESDIIVWPEAAITLLPAQVTSYLTDLAAQLKSHQSTLITGIPVLQQDRYYNGMLALGNGSGTYLKRHLVPFGEYMPFRSLLVWLDNYLDIPMSDFSNGMRRQFPLMANNIPIAAYICFEIAYPTEVLDGLPKGQLLVTISDDSWFGKSMAPAQHLQIAQMRALETGRYLLMSTNDGLTGIVDPQGKIRAILPRYHTAVLKGEVEAMQGSTPWVSFGSIYLLFAFPFLLLLLAFLRQKVRGSSRC